MEIALNPAVLSSQSSIYVTFLASVLIWVLIAGLLVLWLVDGKIKQEIVLHALIAMVIAWIAAEIVKTLFPTLRPYQVNGKLPLTLTTLHTDGSFPSSHTAIAFATAMTVWLHDKKVGILFVLGAIAVGMGRVHGNVHYPLDIIGGALIGFAVAFSVDKIHVHKLLSRLKSSA